MINYNHYTTTQGQTALTTHREFTRQVREIGRAMYQHNWNRQIRIRRWTLYITIRKLRKP